MATMYREFHAVRKFVCRLRALNAAISRARLPHKPRITEQLREQRWEVINLFADYLTEALVRANPGCWVEMIDIIDASIIIDQLGTANCQEQDVTLDKIMELEVIKSKTVRKDLIPELREPMSDSLHPEGL